MAVPDTRCSIVIIKSFQYRGASKRWGNRYHFEGATPIDNAHWTTLANNIIASEKTMYDGPTIVQAIGYDKDTATSTNPHGNAVFSADYTVAGTAAYHTGTGEQATGDSAVYLRYGTDARSARNHPVYLSNYFHGAWRDSGDPDSLLNAQAADVEAYADDWLAGFTDGTSPRERCGPRGAVAVSRVVDPWVRHRDFPQ
jgi:hypothetical protein